MSPRLPERSRTRALLFELLSGADGLDSGCRELQQRFLPLPMRVGVPIAGNLNFPDPEWGSSEFERACARLEAIGCKVVPVDVSPFVEAGELLYGGPWVAERAAAVGSFIEEHAEAVHPVTASIIAGSAHADAVAAFRGFDALRAKAAEANAVFAEVDAIVVPTVDRFPTIAAVDADPIGVNTALWRFTNFMNLLDYAAIAVPAGSNEAGLPFGVTLFSGAGTDQSLLELAARFTDESWRATRGYPLVLAGAHMEGLPLNHQVLDRGGRLVRRCSTAPGYRIFALPGGPPERPALVADPASDARIEVELWDLPEETVGSFLAGIPAPLGLGKVRLDDGSEVVGFIGAAGCEAGAQDITSYGGWRGWLASREP